MLLDSRLSGYVDIARLMWKMTICVSRAMSIVLYGLCPLHIRLKNMMNSGVNFVHKMLLVLLYAFCKMYELWICISGPRQALL